LSYPEGFPQEEIKVKVEEGRKLKTNNKKIFRLEAGF
jgi:hypothetical protein